MDKELIGKLQEIVGEDRVITDDESLKIQVQDIIGYRTYERYKGKFLNDIPDCAVKPKNTEEVSDVFRVLNEKGITAVPKTGGSSVTAGIEAPAGSVVIDGSEMNTVIKIDEINMMVTVECGVPLEYLENLLNKKGYTTGHFPQSLPLAQIGGLVATRSIGQFSTLYGGIEDLIVGMEAVMPNGEIVRIKNVPRRAAGPDLRHLLIGSEGSIGFITEVTLKMFKHNPDNRWMRSYAISSMEDGLSILREIMIEGYRPAVARLHDNYEVPLTFPDVVNDGESLLMFLAEGPQDITEVTGRAIERIVQKYGARDLGTKQMEVWLIHRNDVCNELEGHIMHKREYVGDTCEISGNWSEIGKIHKSVIKRIYGEFKNEVLIGGHSSHSYITGTNIYFVFAFPAKGVIEEVKNQYMNVIQIIMEETLRYGGSISHHHGIGRYRTPWIKEEHGSSYGMLEKLKKTFDPEGIMNSGSLLPVEA